MTLSNKQYDLIMREYAGRRARKAEELDVRRQAALKKVPALQDIETELCDAYASRTRARILGSETELANAKARIADLCESREILLKAAGICREELELQYDCPLCRDTGLIDGQKCACFKRRETELLYDASNIKAVLERENFDSFDFGYYDKGKIDAFSGKTAYENICGIYAAAKAMTEPFVPGEKNILFLGPSGCGKTFLSNCIAKAVLDRGFSVLYFSSQTLFDRLATMRFEEHNIGDAEALMGVDLLIIDDLGTELNNSFVASQLFSLINERQSRRVSTVISTNLDLNTIRDNYSERVSSRLIAGYECLRLFNDDIRIIKKMQ